MFISSFCFSFFFFNDTATTEIYTLSLHDALPIFADNEKEAVLVDNTYGDDSIVLAVKNPLLFVVAQRLCHDADRKSTRLNSSHGYISYAVFCLKKKKNNKNTSFIDQYIQSY